MNLGDFHQLVSQDVKRGNSLDSVIPLRVAMAAMFLERNYSMLYMRQPIEITLNPADANPRFIDLEQDVKSIGYLRYMDSDGNYQRLSRVSPLDIAQLVEGPPGGFWFSGRSAIILDKTPDDAYVLEGEGKFYTNWPSDLSARPWLVTRAADLLLAQTMIYIGNHLRDLQIVQQYRGMRDESLKTVMLSEEESEYDGMDAQISYASKYQD